MPRRKGRVTLPGGGRLPPGHDDATPERLSQAGRAGHGVGAAGGSRRISDPFDLLHGRNLLDRLDVAANETLWRAGDRLRRHWALAALDPLSAVDLTRPAVDGGGGGAPTPGEAAQRHRDEIRRARAAVGPRLLPYLWGTIVEGRPVADLRGLVGDSGHPRTAEALALDRLREALHRLCDLWRMDPAARPLPIAGWRDEGAAAEVHAGAPEG